MTAEEYVRRVDFWLRDLPWKLRRELLSELRGHLTELPPGTDLAARLGTPEHYAADMRAAAGLERRRGLIALVRARRPRNLLLTAAIVTAIGLGIGAVVWVDSYQPLASGSGFRYPAGATGRLGLDGQSVVFRKGRPFDFGITILNTGRFAVRVLGVPYPRTFPWSARLMMSPAIADTGGMHGPYTRFHPFELKPGRVSFLFFKGVYACRTGEARGALGLVDFPVRFSYLWRTVTTQIPLPEQLAIVFRKGCTPAR